MLKKEVAGLPKDTDIVIYCGCCPMDLLSEHAARLSRVKRSWLHPRTRAQHPDQMQTDWM